MAATYAAPALPGFRPGPGPRSFARREMPAHRPAVVQTRTQAHTQAHNQAHDQAQTKTQTRPAPGALRMTRRGRLVVLAVALLVVLLPGAWRAMATAQVDGPSTVSVTVAPGDTLWGIAASMDPGADPRALIAEIRELNGLTQSGLAPGQVLVVPAG